MAQTKGDFLKTNLTENTKAVVSSKGQVVIPREIRKALGIHAGTELLFAMHADGTLTARPVARSLAGFFGRCKRLGEKALSIDDMDDAIAQAVLANDELSRSEQE